jgi:hypothetical protein
LAKKKYAEAEPLFIQGAEGLKQQAAHIPAANQVRVFGTIRQFLTCCKRPVAFHSSGHPALPGRAGETTNMSLRYQLGVPAHHRQD